MHLAVAPAGALGAASGLQTVVPSLFMYVPFVQVGWAAAGVVAVVGFSVVAGGLTLSVVTFAVSFGFVAANATVLFVELK